MRNKKGITLIALIITIIVLLILAGVIISTLDGNNGILQKGKAAASDWKDAEETEQGILDDIYNEMKSSTVVLPTIASKFNNDDTGEIKIGDYVNYTPTTINLGSSEIVENLDLYSGNTDANYNKTTGANPITQETGLKWRVLDKTPEGEIRLISEMPTTSVIRIEGAEGYNNGVKLLDDFCSELYNNLSLTSKVQNLKIEDIEGKLMPAILSEVCAVPYGTSPYTITSNKMYPKIWEQEVGAIINGIPQNGMIDLSDPISYTTEGVVTATTSIQARVTNWSKNFGTSNNNQFVQDIYHELFIRKDGTIYPYYYMSSRAVRYIDDIGIAFCIRRSSNSLIGEVGCMPSWDERSDSTGSMRPVVTLKSNVKVIGGNVETGWNIQ